MKRGLFVLFSDNINLSLINLYKGMIKENFSLDCFAIRKDDLSLHSFENIKVNWLDDLNESKINKYEFIICGRNCYDYLPGEVLINYSGTIYTDDTAFYEGKNVFGDVVFVNGNCNYNNIKNYINFEVFKVGCLKAMPANGIENSIWNRRLKYEKKVLYIESGHYPFGISGRTELAENIAFTVLYNPNWLFVVKPRFLIGEAEGARHRNEDYLYYYFQKYFNSDWPQNLIWLQQYYSIGELLRDADVVIHTYSSAHSEAAIMGKKIVNVCDVHSDETADFRENRFRQIEEIIDKAGNNCSVKELPYKILTAKKARDMYTLSIGGNYEDPVSTIIKIINDSCSLSFDLKKRRRLKGYFYWMISELENRFDNYEYFGELVKNHLGYLESNYHNIEACICYIKNKKKEFAYKYIKDYWDCICKNAFDRAYALRVFWENEDYLSIDKMLNESYENIDKDATFYFFKAIFLFYNKLYDEAKVWAKKYIEHMAKIKYERLDSENSEYLICLEDMVNNENSSIYTN